MSKKYVFKKCFADGGEFSSRKDYNKKERLKQIEKYCAVNGLEVEEYLDVDEGFGMLNPALI